MKCGCRLWMAPNNAMKAESYEYQVIKWTNGKRDGFTTKSVDPATMFDINKNNHALSG